MRNTEIPHDLYLIPSEEDENYILYRPSRHLVALISPIFLNSIQNTLTNLKTEDSILCELEKGIVSKFEKSGFLDSQTSAENKNEENFKFRNRLKTNTFSPHEVTLDITRKCNMRCIYCYSNGGEINITMSKECGFAAIDLCITNAKRKGIFLGLHFHGGGEPSQEFDLLKSFYFYAKKRCSEIGIELKSSVITNGMLPSFKTEFYAQNMEEITLSIDGDELSHDRQRMTPNKKSTFIHVFETAKLLKSLGKKFNLRTTITSENVNRLEDIVAFFIHEFPNCTINIEPVTLVGRAIGKNELTCDPILFAEKLFRAMKIGIKNNAAVFYSGVSGYSQRKEFCAASAPNFCVCADESVTSCFSYSNRDVVKDLFIYGNFDSKRKEFIFDKGRIKKLRSLTMEHGDYCDKCFCKNHCIGDCPAIRKFELSNESEFIEKFDTDFMNNRRCATNRKIVKLLLNDIVRGRMENLELNNTEFLVNCE